MKDMKIKIVPSDEIDDPGLRKFAETLQQFVRNPFLEDKSVTDALRKEASKHMEKMFLLGMEIGERMERERAERKGKKDKKAKR